MYTMYSTCTHVQYHTQHIHHKYREIPGACFASIGWVSYINLILRHWYYYTYMIVCT